MPSKARHLHLTTSRAYTSHIHFFLPLFLFIFLSHTRVRMQTLSFLLLCTLVVSLCRVYSVLVAYPRLGSSISVVLVVASPAPLSLQRSLFPPVDLVTDAIGASGKSKTDANCDCEACGNDRVRQAISELFLSSKFNLTWSLFFRCFSWFNRGYIGNCISYAQKTVILEP